MTELDKALHGRIEQLCAAGDEQAETGAFTAAIATYNAALALVPEPKSDWDAATWILAAIADAAFLGGDTASARTALDRAMTCPGAVGNPFLHLRHGQVLFDQHEPDRAADELMRAYMGGGAEIFEDEDTRYLDFLTTRAQL